MNNLSCDFKHYFMYDYCFVSKACIEIIVQLRCVKNCLHNVVELVGAFHYSMFTIA